VHYRLGEVAFAEDEEYSVIPTSVLRTCRTWCVAKVCFVCVYFDGALADAPASARPGVSTAAAIANIPKTEATNLNIAPSI
jgi:hypothetical protein